jgi:hypothetical protein
MSARSSILATAAALVISAPAYAVTYISTDPYSMFYDMTWDQYDKLGETLGSLTVASDGKIFPECAQWVADWTMPVQPAAAPSVVVPPTFLPISLPDTPPTPTLFSVTPVTSAVPETSTWIMLALGFSALGLFKLKRKGAVR